MQKEVAIFLSCLILHEYIELKINSDSIQEDIRNILSEVLNMIPTIPEKNTKSLAFAETGETTCVRQRK